MKLQITIIVFVIVFLILFYKYYGIQNSFEFNARVVGVDADLGAIVSNIFSSSGSDSKITVKFLVDIKNKSKATISFSDLIINLYTPNGYKIGSSPLTKDNLKTTVLLAGQSYGFTGSVDILLNGTTANIGMAYQRGDSVRIKYNVSLKATVLKIPVSITQFTDIKK